MLIKKVDLDFLINKFLNLKVKTFNEKFTFLLKMLDLEENQIFKLANESEALIFIKSEYHGTFGDFIMLCKNSWDA